MSIRILLADDHKIVRMGLRTLLKSQQGMEVIAEAQDGRGTLQKVKEYLPDIVVMDIGMPELNGIETTRIITSEFSHVKVIALSMHSDRRFVARMLEAGASGYLLKDCAFEELVHAIKAVYNNQPYLSPDITGIVIGDYLRQLSSRTPLAPFNPLTPREREVLQPLTEGKTTKQIAALLHVSAKTIETHRSQIMEKLNLHSVAELTKYAIREGITTLDI